MMIILIYIIQLPSLYVYTYTCSFPRPRYPLCITKTPLTSLMIKGSFIADEIIVPISPGQKHCF